MAGGEEFGEVTDERLLEIEQQSRLYGSSNCWTGTSGTLAAMLIDLLNEVRWLKAERENDLKLLNEFQAEIKILNG